MARSKRELQEINAGSMADIAFLLIVYFMVTTTFAATRGLDFALPKDDDTPPVVEKEESVLIEIRPTGDVIADTALALDKLSGGAKLPVLPGSGGTTVTGSTVPATAFDESATTRAEAPSCHTPAHLNPTTSFSTATT